MASPIYEQPKIQPLSMPDFLCKSVGKFNQSASNMANEILTANSKAKDYKGPTVIRHYHYYNDPFWNSSFFWPRQQVVVLPGNCSPNCSKKDDDKKNERDFAIGLVAAVIGGISLYYIGAGMNKLEDANRELDDTHLFEKMLNRNRNPQTEEDKELLYSVDKVVDLKEQICVRLKNSAQSDLALRATMAASCAFTLLGVFGGTQLAITTGVVAGLISAGGMLFKWGYDSTDTKNFHDTLELHSVTQDVMRRLQQQEEALHNA